MWSCMGSFFGSVFGNGVSSIHIFSSIYGNIFGNSSLSSGFTITRPASYSVKHIKYVSRLFYINIHYIYLINHFFVSESSCGTGV